MFQQLLTNRDGTTAVTSAMVDSVCTSMYDHTVAKLATDIMDVSH